MGELICTNCGHIFYDCEAVHAVDITSTPVGTFRQERSVCPSCGSDELEEASHCRSCGGSFLEESLEAGYYCKDCLENAITEENLREFLQDPIILEAFAEWLHEKEKRNGTDSLEKTH